MIIKIHLLSGRQINIEVEKDFTILHLKRLIESKETFPPEQQKLVFNGNILSNDNKSIEDVGLENNSIVHMIIALRGG